MKMMYMAHGVILIVLLYDTKKFHEINASIIDDDLIQDGLVFGGFAGATTRI